MQQQDLDRVIVHQLQARLEAQRRLTKYWFSRFEDEHTERTYSYLKWLALVDLTRRKKVVDSGGGESVL